jgi:AraC-like DNA-binding protein
LTRRIERAKALLRETDLPVTEIAFRTGWASLGTFGRIFRDITGETPRAVRELSRANSGNPVAVPHCILSAAHRPDLTIAVLEKRRRTGGGKKKSR